MSDPFRSTYRPLTEIEKLLVGHIKAKASDLLLEIDAVADKRAAALARTKLEECVMWAVKGITG